MNKHNEETKFDDAFKGFQSIDLDGEDKSMIHTKMIKSIEKAKSRKVKWNKQSVLTTVLSGILIIFAGYFLAVFVENDNQSADEKVKSPYTELEKQLSDALKTPVYIPYHKELPLKMSILMMESMIVGEKIIERKPTVAGLAYSNLDADEADAKEYEKITEPGVKGGAPIELLYGDFIKNEKHKAYIHILSREVSTRSLINYFLYGDKKTIAGHTVIYKITEDKTGNYMSFAFKYDNNTVYVFAFPLNKVPEDFAISFVEKSIKQIIR
ncbi:hypothetical protein ACFFHH_00410 [Cytobacillus solani]|uniref:Uncharacterized protein n=1 Tax=Cytobacillus solani TaxID=1637975 RepID=A0A0Q3QJZ8_9BACI|nr:hypothetical protein [Cytobacillus solani]KQL18201.1 hypothetical protein AN957_06090 [Cytobacillus solani]USK56042.1 hypothetical protein LIS82_05935 [Cytobacillus solani]